MSTIKIRNIDVKFPYEKPYDIQIDYMKKVIDCLEDEKHGVLESPTGTGKTLCLFAPVTSWLRSKKAARDSAPIVARNKRVLYTARTHSQIAQTVKEVRRCDIEGLNIRVMGARDQLCINPLVLSEKESYIKAMKCKELGKNSGCSYKRRLDVEKHGPTVYQPGEILDIEDLVSSGKSRGICPYYLARAAKESADVMLMPYNYVIDRDSRDVSGRGPNGDIIIFDEGHNVANMCENTFEFTLTSVDLALGISNLQQLMVDLAKKMEIGIDDGDGLDVAQHAETSHKLLLVLKELESSLKYAQVSSELLNIDALYNFLNKAGVDCTTAQEYLPRIEQLLSDSVKLQINGPTINALMLLDRVFHCMYGEVITKVLTSSPDIVERSFKHVVSKDTENRNVRDSKKLALYCFNPSFGIDDVLRLGIKSIIITSGTLAPLPGLIHELGLPEPITLENVHIASNKQVPFMILGYGVNNVKMDGSFVNREDPSYIYSLGMTLTNLITSIPDGVLLLFSSYSVMQNLRTAWEGECGIWKRLDSIKQVFVEPRGKEEFINCMENYRRAIDAGNGAILMGVIRGKVSEGMDFKDHYCRGVFVVGVPFPPVRDPKVMGKEKYAEALTILNPATNKLEKLYGNSYSSVEAMRATNQAIGRVIRHGGDYGAVVLCDYRFTYYRVFSNVSKWLRGNSPTPVNFMTAKKTLREFFRDIHNGKFGIQEIVRQRVNANGDPITSKNEYEEYDHKTAREKFSAPLIAGGGKDFRNALGKSKITYDDNFAEIVESYKVAGSSGKMAAARTPIPEPKSFFDAFELPAQPTIKYREVKLDLVSSELQKRKLDDEATSLSLLPRSSKVSRPRTLIAPMSPEMEPEPENATNHDKEHSKEDLKALIIDYLTKAKTCLNQKESNMELKDTTMRYVRGEIPISDTVAKLNQLFSEPNAKHFIKGFQHCVRKRDKMEWEACIRKICPS